MINSNKTMLFQSRSNSPLKLCEAFDPANNTKKYIFEGIFTACSTNEKTIINRNNRIYRDTEVLRHLPYLRLKIKELGGILGEPAHPDARFDTKITEASHIIRDLHWVPEDAVVWGRLELLDTPAGEICKTVWDSGYKLSVSSRAAGEVDPQTHEVRIEQIFTYDIVPEGGFSQAILQQVSESKNLDLNCKKYLNESLGSLINTPKNSKVMKNGLTVTAMNESVPVDSVIESMKNGKYDIAELSTPLYEADESSNDDKTQPTEECGDASEKDNFKLPSASLNPASVDENDDDKDKDDNSSDNNDDKKDEENDKKDDDKKNLTDEEKAEKRKKILNVEAVDSDGKTNTESEKEEKRAKILDVESEPKDDSDDSSKDDNSSEDDVKSEEECDNCTNNDVKSEEESDDKKDDTDASSVDACDQVPNDIKVKDAEQTAKEVKDKAVNDKEKAEDIKTQTDDDMKKFDALLKKAKKLADVKESIVRMYPFSISMDDENFAQFAALKPGDKNKVQRYILEHNIFNIVDINEQWKTPLLEEKRLMKNWLRLASEEDKKLFAEAPMDVQDAIEESAKYVMIQTKQDADNFWNKTGLRQAAAHKIISESMKDRYTVVEDNTGKDDTVLNENAINLGYSMNYFKMLEDMY